MNCKQLVMKLVVRLTWEEERVGDCLLTSPLFKIMKKGEVYTLS